MFYTLIRTFKASPMVVTPLIMARDENDFIATNSMMIELNTLVFTPVCMACVYKFVHHTSRTDLTPSEISNTMIILCTVQLLCLCFGFFFTQVSVSRSSFYNSWMPSIVWWNLNVSMLVLPWVIIVVAIVVQVASGAVRAYYFLVIMLELGFFAWSLVDFRNIISDGYYISLDRYLGI